MLQSNARQDQLALSVVVAGVLYAFRENTPFVWPDVQPTLYLLGAVFSGVVTYFGLMKAMRTGEVAAVTPFRYTRLLFGITLGVLLFDESFGILMMLGCGSIVVSGLMILWNGDLRVDTESI